MEPIRVLLSAYQCGPGMGSVSQIGWEWYSRLSRLASVTLITHVRNRSCLLEAGAPLEGSEVVYIDTEWFAGPLYRLASRLFPKSEHAVFLLASADFYIYDGLALKQMRKRENVWDLVHAVTPVSPLAATRLHRLGLPLIVGPWNGGLASPRGFPGLMKQDSSWIYHVRSIGRLLDRWFGCTKNAALILSASTSTDRALPKNAHTLRMLENGVDLEMFQPASEISPQLSPLKILFVGRLIPFKGVAMLLTAVARLNAELPLSLTVIGDGPLREELEAMARTLGIAEKVTFAGAVALDRIAGYMRAADVFCLPSVRESGGAVLLEAEACALPVVAVNYGGPAELVDDEVGHLVSSVGPEELVRGLVETLRDVARNPIEWRQRGRQGRIRAEREYGWDARIRRAVGIYHDLLREGSRNA